MDNYRAPLYDQHFEHDACGIGAVVDLKNRATYDTVDKALSIVEKLQHRAGSDTTGETGDGVGLLIEIPHLLMQRAMRADGLELGAARSYGVGMFFFSRDRCLLTSSPKATILSVCVPSLKSTLPPPVLAWVSAFWQPSRPTFHALRRSCRRTTKKCSVPLHNLKKKALRASRQKLKPSTPA